MAEAEVQGPSVDDAAKALMGQANSFTLADEDDQEQPEEEQVEAKDEAATEEPEEQQEAVAEGEEDVSEEEGEESEIALSDIKGLADALEMEPDELLETLKHEIDGNEIPLSQLVGSYQDRELLTNHSKAYQAIQEQAQSQVEEFQKNATIMVEQLNGFEKQLEESMQSADMAALRTSDPAEWGARVTEIQMQLQNIRNARGQMSAEYDKVMQKQMEEYLEREGKRLEIDIPGWGAEKAVQAKDVVKSLGFSEKEADGLVDSRMIKGMLELASLRAENKALKEAGAKAKKAARKVKAKTKTVEPGTVDSKPTRGKKVSKAKILSLQKKLKESGSEKDAAHLFLEKGIV